MADYPGTWYFWAKSVKFIDVGRGIYHFGHDDDLGENPAGSGYRNGPSRYAPVGLRGSNNNLR